MIEPCKLCNSSSFSDTISFEHCFFSDGSAKNQPLVKEECLCCGTIRTKLKVSIDFYERDYQPSRNTDTVAVLNNEVINRSQFIYDWILSLISKDELLKLKSIMEIGCGQGYLLDKFTIKNKHGIEPSNDAALVAKKSANIRNIGYEAISDTEKYDFVLSYCVIEHIENPNSFLEKTYNILNKSGKMCIALPIQDKFNYDLVFADHIHHFNHENFAKLLNQNGFNIVNYESGRGSYANIGMYICEKNEKNTVTFEYIHNNNIQNIKTIFENISNIIGEYENTNLYAFGYGEIARTILPYTELGGYIVRFIDDYSKAAKVITSEESKEIFKATDSVNLILLVNPAHTERIKSLYKDFKNINFLNIFEKIDVE